MIPNIQKVTLGPIRAQTAQNLCQRLIELGAEFEVKNDLNQIAPARGDILFDEKKTEIFIELQKSDFESHRAIIDFFQIPATEVVLNSIELDQYQPLESPKWVRLSKLQTIDAVSWHLFVALSILNWILFQHKYDAFNFIIDILLFGSIGTSIINFFAERKKIR